MCSPPERAGELPAVEPVYRLTAGLSPKVLRRADRRRARPRCPSCRNGCRPTLSPRAAGRPSPTRCRRCTGPASVEGSGPTGPAWQRLAFDELVASQLALALVRGSLKRGRGTAWRAAGKLRQRIEGALPFSLTASQRQALAEIERDLAGDDRMLRLLQGDVGSGKTVVALIAMADVVEAGGQAALMAPTELLARQHFCDHRAACGGGRHRGRAPDRQGPRRRARGDALEQHRRRRRARSSIGTHALFQAGVEFHRLGLVVVDEQHRFGVHQRLALSAKGEAPDVLVMTATPIPRTLVLSYFGDMDVSRLTEKPAGRQPIDTRAVPLDRLDEVVARIGQRDRGGRQGLLGLPAGRRNRRRPTSPPPRSASPRSARLSARASGSCMAA